MAFEHKLSSVLKQDHAVNTPLKPLLISIVVFILLSSVILLIAFAYLNSDNDSIRSPTPYFRLKLFNGQEFQLKDHKKKPILISFFASWCLPCTEEAPIINKAYDEYGPKGVTFLAIAVSDEDQSARQFVLKHNLRFPVGHDESGKIHKAYGISGIPAIIFIDKDGMAGPIHSGGVTQRFLRNELNKLL